MKPTVSIETTIPSYLTAWPSRDLIRLAHQQLTPEWWARRADFEIVASRLVVRECAAGDPLAAAGRLSVVAGIPLLDQGAKENALAAALMRGARLPGRASLDALHIAIAATNGVESLLTWNCSHLANAIFRPQFETICRTFGTHPTVLIQL